MLSPPMSLRMAALAYAIAAPLIGGTIAVSVSGNVSTSPYSSLPVGTAYSGTLYYDPSAAPFTTTVPTCIPPCTGNISSYYLPQPFQLNFAGGSTLSSASGWPNPIPGQGNGTVTVYDDYCCLFVFPSDAIEFDGTMVVTGPLAAESPGGPLFLRFVGPPDLFSSTALPDSFAAISWQSSFGLYFGDFSAGMFLNVTSVQTVPEPGTATLLLFCSIVSVVGTRKWWRTVLGRLFEQRLGVARA
jgi:hypothetical protein